MFFKMDKKKKTDPSSRRQVQSIHSNFSNKNKSESQSHDSRWKQNASRSVLNDENSNDLAYDTKQSLLIEENSQSELTKNSSPSESSEDHQPTDKTLSPSKDEKSNRGKTQPDDPSGVKEPFPDPNIVKSSELETHQEDTSIVTKPDSNMKHSPPKEQPEDKSFNHVNYGMFRIISIDGDGNCLFRCMSHYVLGNQDDHVIVRHLVVSNVCSHWDYFKSFAPDEDMEKYSQRMEENGTYGSEMEIVSFVDVFKCKIKVFFKSTPSRDPLVFGGTYGTSCDFLYSGVNDCGHYDVLQPMASDELQDYTEAVTSLRKKLSEEIEQVFDGEDTKSFDEIIAYLKEFLSKKRSQE